MNPPQNPAGARPSLLAGLLGGALGGAAVGALGSWLAVARNGTLDLGRDRLAFALVVTGTAAVCGLPIGVLGHLLLGRRRRGGSSAVQGAALGVLVFALGYFAIQVAIGIRAPWRPEVGTVDLALGAGAGFFAVLLARPLIGALSRPAWIGLPILLLCGGVGLAFGAGGAADEDDQDGVRGTALPIAEFPEPISSIESVVLLGIDGADWRSIDPLLEAGRMPNLARIVATGVRAPLRVDRPTWSPILWTTIATGVREQRHGVRDFAELVLPGMRNGMERAVWRYGEMPLIPRGILVAPIVRALQALGIARDMPVTAHHRLAPAIWNLASQAGIEVGVVNWYATWPCEVVHGCMVADYDPSGGMGNRLTEAAEVGGSGFAYPPELMAELDSLLPMWWPRMPDPEQIEQILALPVFEGVVDRARVAYADSPEILADIGNSYLGDRFAARVGMHVLEQHGARLLADYMPGIDRISHRALVEDSVALEIVANYYQAVDSFLAPYADLAEGGRTLILMVSDHGWNYSDDIGHEDAPDGIFVAAGAEIRDGGALSPKPHLLDIAPTVLVALGCPTDDGMPGRVLAEAFRVAPQRVVAEYGPYHPEWSIGIEELDSSSMDSKLDELKRLGYVGK